MRQQRIQPVSEPRSYDNFSIQSIITGGDNIENDDNLRPY
jgi:hypothetical protein